VTVIATGLTRNSADSAEPVKRPPANAQAPVTPTPVPSAAATQQTAVEEDDVPAIQRQSVESHAQAAPVSSGRPTPMSIQDYLKNQQRK
jgi:cell division protein FtsZ